MAQQSSEIARRFKQLRQELDLTQKELSEELKTTQANISQIESGEVVPTGNFMIRLAQRFPDVNFNWLISNVGKPRISENDKGLANEVASKTEKTLEKKFRKSYDELNYEIRALRESNNKLITLVTDGKRRNNKKG
jgi:transcriptional regulator with XRE-family HTH domain